VGAQKTRLRKRTWANVRGIAYVGGRDDVRKSKRDRRSREARDTFTRALFSAEGRATDSVNHAV
jgi:hypothetical protein